MSEDDDLLVPKSLFIYGIKVNKEKVLGRGSYGIVYEAQYHGAKVAVKKLHPIFFDDVSKAENIGILKSWKNELQLMSKVIHPNIVQFYGVYNSEDLKSFTLSGSSYIVSELMDKSLRARNLENPKLTYGQIIDILYDIAAGLCCLHEQPCPIMHRDLASKNVLLTVAGRAKIADLGVAKVLSQKKDSLTRHPGTDAYMPVEAIAFDNSYDHSIDIYALGVICLELGIGRDPKATQCLKKVGASYMPVQEAERRKDDLAELEASFHNSHLKPFILQCLADMESRVAAVAALKLLDEQKKSAYYKSAAVEVSTAETSHAQDYLLLKEKHIKLTEDKKKLESDIQTEKRSVEHWRKLANDQKKELDLQCNKLHQKDSEIEKLKRNSAKKQSDSQSSYIPRNPPPLHAHYNYNSSLNQKSQLSLPSHGSLVVAGTSGMSSSMVHRQPTIGSQSTHSTRVRPASTIVTGSSNFGDRAFMTQRSRSEDDALSDVRIPPSLPSSTDTRTSYGSFHQPNPLTTQSVAKELVQFLGQVDNLFKLLKLARTATEMSNYMENLKDIMQKANAYIDTIPPQIKTDLNVSQKLTQLNKRFTLLERVNLDRIPSHQVEELSRAARTLQVDLYNDHSLLT